MQPARRDRAVRLGLTAAKREPAARPAACEPGEAERWSELTFGRGGDNDLVVCERTQFVSRRAGRLVRAGHLIEVHALDQGDLLVVRRADGETVRPARTARGCVAIRGGDAIELGDGRGGIVTLRVAR